MCHSFFATKALRHEVIVDGIKFDEGLRLDVIGFLMNFYVPAIKNGVKRIIL